MKLAHKITVEFDAEYDEVEIWSGTEADTSDIVGSILDCIVLDEDSMNAMYNPVDKSDDDRLRDLLTGLRRLSVDGYTFVENYDWLGFVSLKDNCEGE